MMFCKHCEAQIKIHNKLDMDVYLWRHLKDVHPDIFKKEEDKCLSDIWSDNFRADNPESDYLALRGGV